jgi:hypothetical protein
MVEAPACWKLVGGGEVAAVSIASRAGKRAAAEDAWLGKVAVSTVMAALLRNGLDEAIVILCAAAQEISQVYLLSVCNDSSLSFGVTGRWESQSDAIIDQGACEQRLPAIFGTAGQELD